MILIFVAFGLTLLTSVVCVVAVLVNRLSVAPMFTCAMSLVPVAIAALPMPFHRYRRVMAGAAYIAALLLFVWVVITGFSVGMFYLPATAMMAIAAVRVVIKTPV